VGAAVSLVMTALVILGLAQSGQRSPLAFFLAACAGWGYLYARSENRRVSWKVMAPLLVAAALTLAAGMAFFGRAVNTESSRFGWDHIRHDPRAYLWQVAGRMFMDSPLLGMGSGRYTYRFYDFYDGREEIPSGVPVTRFNAEAHSLYFQVLAEQGAVGLLAWSALLVMIFYGGWRYLGMEGQEPWRKRAVLTLLLSLLLWAAFAVFNNMFYVRALGLYFWAAAGIMVALAYTCMGGMAACAPLRGGMRWGLALAFIIQVFQAAVKPVPHYFSTGFHGWEPVDNGRKARWTTRRAVMKIDDYEGDRLRLKVSAPLPGLGHPQKTVFWFGGEKKEIELGNQWEDAQFSPGNRGGSDGLLWVDSVYAVNPQKAGFGEDGRDLGVFIMEVNRKPSPGGAGEES